MSGVPFWQSARRLCEFFLPVADVVVRCANEYSVIDEVLKSLERMFFIQKGNEKLEAESNGRIKKE